MRRNENSIDRKSIKAQVSLVLASKKIPLKASSSQLSVKIVNLKEKRSEEILFLFLD